MTFKPGDKARYELHDWDGNLVKDGNEGKIVTIVAIHSASLKIYEVEGLQGASLVHEDHLSKVE